MFAAEKAIVCGKGTGVWGGKHMVDGICNKALLFFGGISPKQKYYWTASVVQMEITQSVKISQPLPLWEFAAPALTVRTVFKSKTPCRAQGIR